LVGLTNVPTCEQGADMGKRIVGRKRSIIIDTTSLMLTVLVTAASNQDSVAGERLLDRLAADHPGIHKGWADRGYREYLVDHAARLGIDLEVVRRIPETKSLTVLPRRWVVERTQGWLMHHRRLARDYEALPFRYTNMIALITRRITHAAAAP